MIWESLAAGSGVLQGAMNYFSQRETNKSNERIAREANTASAKQAQEQMAFQEEMSNTSYQRAMEDMRKAGLNPILAYSQGGASTPSGAMGDVKAAKLDAPQISGIDSSAAQAINTALQMRRDASAIELQDQQKVNTIASTQKQLAEAERTKVATINDIASASRQAEIHQQGWSSRALQQQEADFDRRWLQYRKTNENIQKGTQTVEGIGDAIYSLLPGGKFIRNLFDRNSSSAKDAATRSRNKNYIPKKTKHIIYTDKNGNRIKVDPYTGEF